MELELNKEEKVSFEKWAKYTVQKFEFAVSKFRLHDTGKLINSFHYQVQQEANGDSALITFTFEYYLRMLDMGVGRGDKRDDFDNKRKKYPVYNKIFWGELQRLSELLQIYYLKTAQKIIVYGTD